MATNDTVLAIARPSQRLGQQLLTLRALREEVAPPLQPGLPTPPVWVMRYPAELQAPLLELAATTPAAAGIAGRLLAKAFPDPAKVQIEIDAIIDLLAERPADQKLTRRLENLRTRLHSPILPSPARLQRLADKLVKASNHARLAQWQTTL